MMSKRVTRLRAVPITDTQLRILSVMLSTRHKPRLWIVALAVLVSAMAGCGNPTIVGKWRMSGSSSATVWEFSKNGSVLIGSDPGRYSFGDDNRIKIETPFATTVYQIEVSGDHMTLREAGGSKLEFTRIRETQS